MISHLTFITFMRNFLILSISHFLDHFDYIDPTVIPPERQDADAEPEEAEPEDAGSQDANAKTNEVCDVVTTHFTMFFYYLI